MVGNTALVADRVGSNPSVGIRVLFSGKTNAFSGKVNAFSYLLKMIIENTSLGISARMS